MFRKLMAAGCSLLLGACATTVNEPDAETPSTVEVTDVPEGAEPAPATGELIDGGVLVAGDAPATTNSPTGPATDRPPPLPSLLMPL